MPTGIGDEGGALMLKVDAHQHFWSYRADEHPWMAGDAMTPLRRDFLPADLQPLLQRQGVAATVAVQARASEGETRYLLSLAAQVRATRGPRPQRPIAPACRRPAACRRRRTRHRNRSRPLLHETTHQLWVAYRAHPLAARRLWPA